MILEGFFLMEEKHAVRVQILQDHWRTRPVDGDFCRKSGMRRIGRRLELGWRAQH
jgi:hypothetical protein